MDDQKKLKRGLKDLSPLFGKTAAAAKGTGTAEPRVAIQGDPENGEGSLRCLNVINPEEPGDSLFLGSFLASRLSRSGESCFMLTLKPRYKAEPRGRHGWQKSSAAKTGLSTGPDRVRHLTLNWKQFEMLWKTSRKYRHEPNARKTTLFFDFEAGDAASFEKVIPVLDQWILLMRPHLESLKECYRLIKASRSVNQSLEYYILIDGAAEDPRSALLFERFADLVSRRLGISLVWLGCLHSGYKKKKLDSGFDVERLFMGSGPAVDTLEKRGLAAVLNEKPEILSEILERGSDE